MTDQLIKERNIAKLNIANDSTVLEKNLQDSKTPRSIIIIPAHNEEANIIRVIHEIQSYQCNLDIVVIDDYSKDKTAELARKEKVAVINLPFNLGYGGAVQTGFKYALKNGYHFALQLDGDGQHDPQFIPGLLKKVQEEHYDLALGSRFLGRADYNIPIAKKIGMIIFGKIIHLLTNQKISDPTSGYQAMNRKVIAFFANDNYPADYPDADTLILLKYAGFKIAEVPVIMRERIAGTSMHSFFSSFYYIYKMFLSIFVVYLRKQSLRKGVA